MAHFDLFVIGGGSGGVACARRSASYGTKVGLAEGSRMGGTCVIRGCVPKKLMHYGAHFAESFKIARDFGWDHADPAHRFQNLLEARNKEILRLNDIYVSMLKKAGVEIYPGWARVVGRADDGKLTIEVGDAHHTTDKLLIAVGCRPTNPKVDGIEHVVSSDNILEDIYEFPKRLIVVGAGYIGVEIACIMNGFGAETTMVLRGDKPLRGFDDDLRTRVTAGMEHHGITLMPGTTVASITGHEKIYRLETNRGPLEADLVLYATGRDPIPNTKGIGLESLGLDMDAKGAIHVDDAYRTNVDGVFAVGDCSDHAGAGLNSGQHDLTPVAVAEGRVIAETHFNANPHKVAYNTIPTAIFSMPQASAVGMSEAQAEAAGHRVQVYVSEFRPMLYTLGALQERTFMKLVVDQESDAVLGCQMVGDDAAEIMQGLAVALTAGATKADFDRTVGIHPSSAEEFVTMYQPRA